MKQKIYLSSDHNGFDLKDLIKSYLEKNGYDVVDLGTNNNKDLISYADQGKKLAQAVSNDKGSYGIGVCGSGMGISYSVNRFKGIRGARITSIEDARLAKERTNANVLLLGGRQIAINQAEAMIKEFFDSKFEGGDLLESWASSLDENW